MACSREPMTAAVNDCVSFFDKPCSSQTSSARMHQGRRPVAWRAGAGTDLTDLEAGVQHRSRRIENHNPAAAPQLRPRGADQLLSLACRHYLEGGPPLGTRLQSLA